MGCGSCSVNSGEPKGCKSNGHCATGGCNRMNTFDWLEIYDLEDPSKSDIVEVGFKHGSKKEFFRVSPGVHSHTGDWVVVETGNGWDVGKIGLSGALVALQMKKKKVHEDRVVNRVMRVASGRDVDRMLEARDKEKPTLVRARAIVRTLDLAMKIGDIEYQADLKKATFYYTAEGRVDFRELVRSFAKEFKVKIEMRQIGARQESARIGGLGPCGRELCCSTWLSDFKSVSTVAARYQNLAINQAKLSGQCGRLKCCLNYELDTYLEALEGFPKNVDVIKTQTGKAHLIKMDIFKGLMYYSIQSENVRGKVLTLETKRVWELKEMNAKGEYPEDLMAYQKTPDIQVEEDLGFADVTGQIELPQLKKKKKKYKNRNYRGRRRDSNRGRSNNNQNRKPKK